MEDPFTDKALLSISRVQIAAESWLNSTEPLSGTFYTMCTLNKTVVVQELKLVQP
jgi:hypothetical protein